MKEINQNPGFAVLRAYYMKQVGLEDARGRLKWVHYSGSPSGLRHASPAAGYGSSRQSTETLARYFPWPEIVPLLVVLFILHVQPPFNNWSLSGIQVSTCLNEKGYFRFRAFSRITCDFYHHCVWFKSFLCQILLPLSIIILGAPFNKPPICIYKSLRFWFLGNPTYDKRVCIRVKARLLCQRHLNIKWLQ